MKILRHASLHYDTKSKQTKFEKSSFEIDFDTRLSATFKVGLIFVIFSNINYLRIDHSGYPRSKISLQFFFALFINYVFKSCINDDINNIVQ